MTEKIDTALNETRILVLVAQVVLGFQYQSIFQSGFDKLPLLSQYLKLSGLGLMLLALSLLLSPASYHRIVEDGTMTRRFYRYITRVAMPALLPFAVGLGMDFYVVGAKLISRPVGLLTGAMACSIALFFWYGLEAITRREDMSDPLKRQHEDERKQNEDREAATQTGRTPLKERIKCVLTEARVVLPGAQALLGFQFAAVLTDGFDRLATPGKQVHFASLAAIAFSSVLLMAPAAFHRIVERGEETERLHTFASRMILGAMAFLAIGIGGDVFVVAVKVLRSEAMALLFSGLTLLLYGGFWFGYMLYRREMKMPISTDPEARRSLTASH